MNIRFAHASEQGAMLVQEGLQRLARRTHHPHHQALTAERPQIHSPHPVFDLGGEALAAGSGLASAKASGLRYLVQAGDRHVAAAELQIDANGQARLLRGLHHGPHAQACADELAQLAASTGAEGPPTHEVRLLRCAAAGLLALWLKSDSADDTDRFIPLAPAPAGLNAGHSYDETTLLDAIRPVVARRPAHKTDVAVP